MKKIISLSLWVSVSFFLIKSAYAGTPGFYVGGGLGISRLDTNDKALFDDKGWTSFENSLKKGGLGWKLFAGYNINEFIGMELGYSGYAHSKYSSVINYPAHSHFIVSLKNSLRALSFVGKASLPVGSSGFNLYALGGIAQVNSHAKLNGYNETSNKLCPTYGAGIGYAFSEQLSSQLEISRIKGEKRRYIGSVPNADALTLNLAYFFN